MRLVDSDADVYTYIETWTCNCSEYGVQKVMAVDDISYLPEIAPETLPVVQELIKQLDAAVKNLSLVCERCKHNEDCMKNHNSCTGFSDFEPKVREDVRGAWEWFEEEYGIPVYPWDRDWGWRCSHCKNTLNGEYYDPDRPPKFKFCPNCGADMRKETT